MTRDEIEAIAFELRTRRDDGWVYGTVKAADGLELCRLALIGHAIDKREREIAAALDEMAAEGQACDRVIDDHR